LVFSSRDEVRFEKQGAGFSFNGYELVANYVMSLRSFIFTTTLVIIFFGDYQDMINRKSFYTSDGDWQTAIVPIDAIGRFQI